MMRGRVTKGMRFPLPLTKSQIIALSTLADKGPTNIYQIMKENGKAYSLMFNAIKELEKCMLVMFVEKKQTSKGTMANVYDLTFSGILAVLEIELAPEDTERWNYVKIRKIIKKYADWLPLVFGKWIFFQKMGTEKIALFRLKKIVENQQLIRDKGEPLAPTSDMKTQVCWLFYFLGLFPASAAFDEWQIRHDTEAWMNGWKQDKDITAYFMKELENYRKRLKNLGAIVERHITLILGSRELRKE